ncbi:class I SAM-dependent methyltransferase [Rhabdothermincola salaria]|uniref:class I SAM-dependent methyltransferase n=1 Tax=Rhabdothermincola salaria TaxID=2903142 RepID=UPI001E589AE5|nr:class I SAM-dependent methyltransferase [Rhabdothermincola salaria]MCD9624676.1 class I SAM-dependent methyltransferase [Rhabdothermincola salaria]
MADDFFESVYARAEGDDAAVPWQHAISRRLVEEWLADLEPDHHRRALVVASGLGDDAAALAEHGLEVVAFDAAPSAVAWARRRHPEADVDWQVADLFALPADWHAAFDLVVEVFTVQSIAPEQQVAAVEAIHRTVAPGGLLMAVAITVADPEEPSGPPWPLRPHVVDALVDGFHVRRHHDEDLAPGLTARRLELERP